MERTVTCKSLALWGPLAESLGVEKIDIDHVVKRADEGLPFFTVTLPLLGKDLDRSLETGVFIKTSSFKRYKDFPYPAFLHSFFSKIFDEDGTIRKEPCVNSIRVIRQLTYLFYKLEVPVSDQMASDAYDKFVSVDKSIPLSLPVEREVISTFRTLFPSFPEDSRPHHSGGATADKVSQFKRRILVRNIPSLMRVFEPDTFFYNSDHMRMHFSVYSATPVEPTARFALVPKDSRGPRGICMEPHERMFCQKGLQEILYDFIEHRSPARGRINFTNQSINRALAASGSFDRSYATIDLSDASDRVPWHVIASICPTDWLPFLVATRSAVASVPGHGDIELKKFAAMGSALCFPIEAMFFYSIVKTITDDVYVYGDDIIVPNGLFDAVCSKLSAYGLVVNSTKSLHKGRFRESCGAEYYGGCDISVLRLKTFNAASYIAFLNNTTNYFGSVISDAIAHTYKSVVGGTLYCEPLQYATEPRSMVYYTDSLPLLEAASSSFRYKIDNDLHLVKVRRPVVTIQRDEAFVSFPRAPFTYGVCGERDGIPGYYGLHDWFTRVSSLHPLEEEHTRLYDERGSAIRGDILDPDKLPAYTRVKTRISWRWDVTRNISLATNRSMN
jgi:hypothetical protein